MSSFHQPPAFIVNISSCSLPCQRKWPTVSLTFRKKITSVLRAFCLRASRIYGIAPCYYYVKYTATAHGVTNHSQLFAPRHNPPPSPSLLYFTCTSKAATETPTPAVQFAVYVPFIVFVFVVICRRPPHSQRRQ